MLQCLNIEWYKRKQSTIRSDLYNGLTDSLCRGETSASYVGRRVILPSSFNGGPRHKIQQYQDVMAICRWDGTPNLFVTMMCNPNWPEIECLIQQMVPGQPSTDRPNNGVSMFKIKLDELMNSIRKKHHFGRTKADMFS